jgi:acetyl esterase/lipase
VTTGNSFTLTWSSVGATTCMASGGGADGSSWSGALAAAGTATQTATVPGTFTYTVVCSAGNASTPPQQVAIKVSAASSSSSSGSGGGGGGGIGWLELDSLAALLGLGRLRRARIRMGLAPPAVLALSLLWISTPLFAADGKAFDAAAAFGARPSVSSLRLSPDGQSVVYLAPTHGQGSAAYTLGLTAGAQPKVALEASGKPDRLAYCSWVAADRLICVAYALKQDPVLGPVPYSRVVAMNADGSNFRLLSNRDNWYTHGVALGGGYVIDSLPAEDGKVLMTRVYLPDDKINSHFGSTLRGLGVDWVDTRDLSTRHVEKPRMDAELYLSDGRGNVRIVGLLQGTGKSMYQYNGIIEYMYRPPGSPEWRKLSEYNDVEHTGFRPTAVDPDLNVAYGFKKLDGRLALYKVTLDADMREELVYANPDVDVDDLLSIGRHDRVIGVSYATATRHAVYFDPQIKQLLAALAKALPGERILRVVDSSVDESRLLIFAGSDTDPGVYYIFDRKTHQLQTFLVVRGALEGVKLASVKPVTYPAADGVAVPAYLTLPPGAESAKGLPAIVLPHGGPSARDEWGFQWLPQFFAARGFAVLQPEFRGSSGYGDAWFEKNGFKSWDIAIGDVLAAGRWLVSQGIADPAKLGVVGWSYGGYAALQSAVVDSGVFKAVVAVAPVTDLAALKQESASTYSLGHSSHEYISEYIGSGPHIHEGSPAEHADRIKVPVLLFHGAMDRNVSITQSQTMCSHLTAAGGKCELVTWDDLDHQLDDSTARTQMLRRSDEFLRAAFGM